MPWLKKAAEAPTVEKIWELSNELYRIYDASLHYCAANLSDGHLPPSRISPLTPKPATKQQIDALVVRRLWHRLPDLCASCLAWRKKKGAGPLPRSGYLVHDFLEFNPSRIEWERRLAGHRAGGVRGAATRWGDGLSDNSSDNSSDGLSHESTDGLSHGSSHDLLSTKGNGLTRDSRDDPLTVSRTPRRSDSYVARARVDPDEPAIPDAANPLGTDRISDLGTRRGRELRPLAPALDSVVASARTRSAAR